mmetsp:Transcript_12798/g.38395  ORF Transcript_12798/g.38395 Transcript_12798/m.38395 type:complete len:211 (+) Transcript_12798:1720-2352(+)
MQKIEVIMGATISRLPIRMQLCEITHVPMTATRGSSPNADPKAKGLSTGYRLSRAIAWRTRDPPNSEPNPDERDEMRIPVTTKYGETSEAFWKTLRSFRRVSRAKAPAKQNTSSRYVQQDVKTAQRVPTGIARAGFFWSPDRLAPSMIPVAIGKIMAYIRRKSHWTGDPFSPRHCGDIVHCGSQFSFKLSTVNFTSYRGRNRVTEVFDAL